MNQSEFRSIGKLTTVDSLNFKCFVIEADMGRNLLSIIPVKIIPLVLNIYLSDNPLRGPRLFPRNPYNMTSFDSAAHREYLMLTQGYIASPLFTPSVEFKKSGPGSILKEVVTNPGPDTPIPDALLTVVGTMSQTQPFITPTGNFNHRFDNANLAKSKYVFIINKPRMYIDITYFLLTDSSIERDPVFAPDFDIVVSTLKELQRAHTRTDNNHYLTVSDRNEDGVRFSFPVFSPIKVNFFPNPELSHLSPPIF
jgi:hypothetical protein